MARVLCSDGFRPHDEEAPLRIAIYAFDGVPLFHLAVPQTVFDEVRRQHLADWHCALFSDAPGSVRTAEGYSMGGIGGLDKAQQADLLIVPSWFDDGRPAHPGLTEVLRESHRRGAVIAGLCLGALPVADTGLLDGRSAVTHWHAAAEMAERRPDVLLDGSVLYIDHGDILTSAGTASGIDACLHLVRTRLGAAAANSVARALVVAPHRDGGQAQFVERATPQRRADDPMSGVLEWALRHLGDPLTVEDLAAAARMSRRSFVRAFRASTGTTPAAWVRSRRLDESRRLLEESDLSIDQIAEACGFGSPVTFRQGFSRAFSTTPSEYRRRFDARHDPGVPNIHLLMF